jgi:hypothetical protein
MATNRSGHQPGGGLHSRNVRHTTAPKVEPRAHAINPSWVAQRGALVGNHATNTRGSTDYTGAERSLGRGYNNPIGPTNMALSGPGAGRTIYSSGSQCQTGAANPGSPRPNPRREALEGE